MASPVRLGLIGVGRWGKNYIRTLETLSARARLTHLATSKPENARLVSHPISVVSDWRALLTSDCDALIVASPSATHPEIVEACLAAGKPCLVEKPLCLDLPTAERICRRIQAAPVPVLVEYTQLFNVGYQTLKRTLARTGERIRLIVSEGLGPGPFRNEEPALWDWGPHDIGLCLDLLGTEPQQVAALAGPLSPGGVPEQVSLRCEFPAGVTAWMHLGFFGAEKRRTFSVITDERWYLFDDQAPERLTVADWPFARRYEAPSPAGWRPIPLPPWQPPLTNAVNYFLDAVQGGDRRLCDAELTLRITRVLAACEAAMDKSRCGG